MNGTGPCIGAYIRASYPQLLSTPILFYHHPRRTFTMDSMESIQIIPPSPEAGPQPTTEPINEQDILMFNGLDENVSPEDLRRKANRLLTPHETLRQTAEALRRMGPGDDRTNFLNKVDKVCPGLPLY